MIVVISNVHAWCFFLMLTTTSVSQHLCHKTSSKSQLHDKRNSRDVNIKLFPPSLLSSLSLHFMLKFYLQDCEDLLEYL